MAGLLFLVSGGLGTAAIVAAAGTTPARTVTVNVGTGVQGVAGPVGPAGPQGPAGTGGNFSCPVGYTGGYLIINHPTGHLHTFTCLRDKP
jgi:hypothetical protein